MRAWAGLLLLCALGCASVDEPAPEPGSRTPWIDVTLTNATDERVVEATLSPFDTPGFVQSALDQTLAPGASVQVRVRAGTWSLWYMTESGREASEPALELSEARTIALE